MPLSKQDYLTFNSEQTWPSKKKQANLTHKNPLVKSKSRKTKRMTCNGLWLRWGFAPVPHFFAFCQNVARTFQKAGIFISPQPARTHAAPVTMRCVAPADCAKFIYLPTCVTKSAAGESDVCFNWGGGPCSRVNLVEKLNWGATSTDGCFIYTKEATV